MFSKPQTAVFGLTSSPQDSRDLDNNISLIKEYDERRSKVCKEFKKLNDCLDELNCNEKQLLDELNCVATQHAEKLDLVIEHWSRFVNEVSKNREDLATIITRTSIEPFKSFQGAFNELKHAIKRYEQLICDNAKYSQKVAKYKESERTSTMIVKLEEYKAKCAQAQSDYQLLRTALERELSLFLHQRCDYLQPSLTAFISSEILYSGNNLTALNQLEPVMENLSEEESRAKQSTLFESIDDLSIVTS